VKIYKYPVIPKENGVSEKIIVQFVINGNGNIVSAKILRGEDRYLIEEALRLIYSIPKMIGAKQRGENASCSFTVPINFELQ
jgi:protein TonB